MKQREFWTGGPKVGAVGLGCMSFAGFYGAADDAESHRTLAAAWDMGVTHLDTANIYGNGKSEEVIGAFLKATPRDFVIATKAGIWRDPEGKRGFNNSEAHLRSELETSLKRLGVDHVGLYYIHRRDPSIPIEDVMGTLMRFMDEGKIGGIGFSEIAPHSVRRAAAVGPVAAVQSEYSLWSRQPEMGMIDVCREVGAGFVPFSPVARAMFGAETPDPATFGPNDIRKNNPRFVEPNFSANVAHFDRFRALAGDLGVASASLAVAWVLDQGPHLVPIPGTRTVAHLEELAAADAIVMTDAIRTAISDVMPRGFAHGDRYSDAQIVGVERYC